jgi:hypothetical protein
VTIEPIVSKTTAFDPYFTKDVWKRMVNSIAIEQGRVFERFMMEINSTYDLYPSGCNTPSFLICVQLVLTRQRLLAGRSLDLSKAQLT